MARADRSDRVPRAVAGLLCGGLLLAGLALAQNPKNPRHVSVGELTNPLLSPEYAQWLIGPNSWLLDEQERQAYLLLDSDAQAAAFIEEFWQQRAGIRRLYEQRVAEADKKFRESAWAGHRTDRGTIWVLYGEPEETSYLDHRDIYEPTIEQWKYPKAAEAGLDGRRPNRLYRFAKDGDLTIFYQQDPRARARRRIEDAGRLPEPP